MCRSTQNVCAQSPRGVLFLHPEGLGPRKWVSGPDYLGPGTTTCLRSSRNDRRPDPGRESARTGLSDDGREWADVPDDEEVVPVEDPVPQVCRELEEFVETQVL